MDLSTLPRGHSAQILGLKSPHADDAVARRLGELGFVPGATVRLLAVAPWGRATLAVQLGEARFALRRAEAARVLLSGVAR